jgi:hypothetical protein
MANLVNGPQIINSTFGTNRFIDSAILATFSDTVDDFADYMAIDSGGIRTAR